MAEIAHLPVAPRCRMAPEAPLQRRAVGVVPARLDDLRSGLPELLVALGARTNDRDMAGLLRVLLLEGRHDEDTPVCQALRFLRGLDCKPAVVAAFVVQPIVLGVGEQDGAVLRRPQDVDAELAAGRGHESAAMRMR